MQSADNRIFQRNQKFGNSRPYILNIKYAVDLRKDKRKEYVVKCRKSIDKNAENINIGNLLVDLLEYNVILSDNIEVDLLTEILENIRMFVCKHLYIPSYIILDSGILQKFVRIIRNQYPDKVIEETTWILCNLATGSTETVNSLIDLGFISILSELIDSNCQSIKENVIWCIGNIAGDSEYSANEIISSEFLLKLQKIFTLNHLSTDVTKISIWALANLSNKSTIISFNDVKIILKLTKDYLIEKKELVYEVLRILCGISSKSEDFIQILIDKSFGPFILNLIVHESEEISSLAIRAAGNILSGTSAQTQVLINLGVIEKLQVKIYSTSPAIRKEVYRGLSNITGGTSSQVATLLDHSIMNHCFSGLLDYNNLIRQEVSWMLRNIGVKGCPESIRKLGDLGVFKYLKHGLEDFDNIVSLNCAQLSLIFIKNEEVYKTNFTTDEHFSEFFETFEKFFYRSKECLKNTLSAFNIEN